MRGSHRGNHPSNTIHGLVIRALVCVVAAAAAALTPRQAAAQAGAPWVGFLGPGGGHIEVADAPALNPTAAITIEAWVNLLDTGGWGGGCPGIVGKGYVESYWLGICSGYPRFYTQGSGSAVDAGFALPVGAWNHLAVTYDGATVKFYINGGLASSTATGGGPLTTSTKPLMIGSDPDWLPTMKGYVDELRIWNVARSGSAIAAAMNTPITSPQAGLVAVWSMDGSPDATVGGFHGTIVGDVTFSSTVTPPSCPFAYFIPTSGHLPGVAPTQWRTYVSILNNQSSPASVTMFLLKRDHDNSSPASVFGTVLPHSTLEGQDVVLSLFGESNLAAALKVCSDTPVLVSSRTYNQSPTGTYGQGVPGFPANQAIADGGTAYLTGLQENAAARSNLGFVNTSLATVSVTVAYFAVDGTPIGTQVYSLPPQGYIQRTRAFRDVTGVDVAGGFVSITPSGGAIFAYASVIDATTGDPAYYNAE